MPNILWQPYFLTRKTKSQTRMKHGTVKHGTVKHGTVMYILIFWLCKGILMPGLTCLKLLKNRDCFFVSYLHLAGFPGVPVLL
jgi:hypothetical protein